MKRVLVAVLAVGMVASAADAAELSMRWASAPTSQKFSMATSDTQDIEVVVNLQAGEILSALGFGLEDTLGTDNLSVTGASAASPDGLFWRANNTTTGDFGTGNAFVVLEADTQVANLSGPGTFVLGSYTIHLDNSALVLDEIEIVFNITEPNNQLELYGAPIALPFLDETGHDFAWDARFNNTTFPGYVAFGDWGSPGWSVVTGKGNPVPGAGQERNPLIVTIPEPATLGLLAVGGVALIRRRAA